MSSQKINTTLTYGGLACTVLTVEELTGLEIPYAAEVQFGGVTAMSTAVGGVEVCVAEDIEDEHTNTYLKAGKHSLQGLDALQFLRTRHGIGDGSDLTRINNQQVFMSALLRTIKSSDTLSDFAKVYSLAKAATANMQLSTSLNSPDTLVSIALALKDIDLAKLVFVQVPTYYTDGGVAPSQPDFAGLFEALAADKPIQLGGSTGRGATVDPDAPAAPAPPRRPPSPARAAPPPRSPRSRMPRRCSPTRPPARPRTNTPAPSAARSTTSRAAGGIRAVFVRMPECGYDSYRVLAVQALKETSHSSA